MVKIHNFELEIDWKLINALSKIDRFDATWSSIEKKEGSTLNQLKSIATVRSVGASTRIEGSKMSDEEVDVLLNNLSGEKLETRDSQEVAGYFEVMNEISDSYEHLRVSESEIKGLHNLLMRHSQKDEWHRGDYKQHNNNVQATLADGTKQTIFNTTPPGYETEDAMNALVEWYKNDKETHPIIKCAIFSYEFVSIHPFQDGNGRLSRLVASALLLKNGYLWIQYVSFEHEIENRKPEYYKVLRRCQSNRPNENITLWIMFFLDALNNIQQQLLKKLEETGKALNLSPKEKSIVVYISNYPGCKSGAIATGLNIPNPTVKSILKRLVENKIIEKLGLGRGTNYRVY